MPSAPHTRTSYMAHRDGESPAADDPLLDFAPVPHVAPRRNSITGERQRAFVAACGVLAQAAKHIGVSLEALYKLRNRPGAEGFRAAWDMAVDRAIARLEHSTLARALEGEERMVVSGGKVLGSERRFSDRLAMFFLRQRRPERYGALPAQELKPGHPIYERIKREVLDEEYGDEQEVLDSLDAFIDTMARNRRENTLILAEADGESGDDEAPDEPAALPPPAPAVRSLD